jgi:hypothetical protein
VNRDRGLDASDESYYLLSVQFPHAARASATGFDSFLAPVWWLADKSIGRFRVAGVLMLVGTLFAAARLCSQLVPSITGWTARASTIVIGAALAALSFTFYTLWLPTPGYNLVALGLALLVAALTAALAVAPEPRRELEERRVRFPADCALGFVLAVGLVVKAPSFAILAILSAVALIGVRGPRWLLRRLWRLLSGFAGAALLFVLLTGSPPGIVRRFSRGLRANGLLGGQNNESLWEVTSMRQVYGPWFLRFVLGALLVGLAWRLIRRDQVRLSITIIGSLFTALLFVRSLPGGGTAAFTGNAGWWWIRFSAMTFLWITATARAPTRKIVLGPLLALMALGVAAGSGNGLIHQVVLNSGVLGVGVIVHALIVVSSHEDESGHASPNAGTRRAAGLLPVALFFVVGSLASSSALRGALVSPYRLNGDLQAESVAVNLGGFGTVKVHPETARYIHQLQAIAPRVPVSARDCLVDLAGGTPLSAIALGARPAATPWILGGHPGSNAFADYLLAGTPCLSGPYLLIEAPSGTRSIDLPGWLRTTGATFLGRVRYSGYTIEDQLIWLVPGSTPESVQSGS